MMTYYVTETEYVGPNSDNLSTDYARIAYGHYYDINTDPGRTNMSHTVRAEGWIGTNNDVAEYARGAFDTLASARAAVLAELTDGYRLASDCDSCPEPQNPDTIERYYVGDDKATNLWDAGDWLAASKYETDEGISLQQCGEDGSDALIIADTTDDELAELADSIEALADSEGVTLFGGALATLEAYRERAMA